ncbi:hypothetical protein EYF80_012037 [Liparis tanakae]|uniref:Uncharacterized protein n=1 Tax=Liparis tanakae TaxID=230148 RepID=A0A4Z2IIA3_9TELE|nr:hypothetical protein EYF80_012037 [Liparis tanakae]
MTSSPSESTGHGALLREHNPWHVTAVPQTKNTGAKAKSSDLILCVISHRRARRGPEGGRRELSSALWLQIAC